MRNTFLNHINLWLKPFGGFQLAFKIKPELLPAICKDNPQILLFSSTPYLPSPSFPILPVSCK